MRTINLKEFEKEFSPIVQQKIRTYHKYYIINDRKAGTYMKLATKYNYHTFTGVQRNKELLLYPGKRYHLENSIFIQCENPWEVENENILVDLNRKKKT